MNDEIYLPTDYIDSFGNKWSKESIYAYNDLTKSIKNISGV